MSERVRCVLMTADTVGGVFTYAVELGRALSRYGVDLALATMGGRCSREQRKELERVPNACLFESEFRLEWMQDCWADVGRAGDFLLELSERVRPDCVHLNGYAHAVLPWRAPVVVVGHSCVLSWWAALRRVPLSAEWARYADAVRRGLRAADIVIAPSRAMLAALEEHYGPLADARVIPNAVAEHPAARARKLPLVFSAGRLWDEAKNVRVLLQIAGRLPWPVVLSGPTRGPGGTEIVCAGPARLLGSLGRDRLRDWLARAAIYALPARYEPFGLSVLEAAQAECALVLSAIPSFEENWAGAALLVPPSDPGALRDALLALIADEDRRQRLARAARARAAQFAPDTMARAYLGAYSDAVEKAGDRKKESWVCAWSCFTSR